MKRKYRNFSGSLYLLQLSIDQRCHFDIFPSFFLSLSPEMIVQLNLFVQESDKRFNAILYLLESRVDFTSLLRTCYIRARNTLHMQLSRRVATTGRTSVSVGQREADKVDVVNVICDAFEWYLNQRGVVGVVAVGWGLDRNVFETHFQSWKFRFLLRLRTNRD